MADPTTLSRRALLALIGASTAISLLPRAWAGTRGHPYLPLVPGTTRRYVTTQASLPADAVLADLPGSRSTETILDQVDDGQRINATISESWDYTPQASRYHRIWTSDGILADVGPMETPAGRVVTISAGGVFLPQAFVRGARWTYATRYESPLSRMEIDGALEVRGEESVDTPAGSFTAMHLCHTVTNTVTMKDPDIAPSVQAAVEDLYYAVGVGLALSASQAANGLESRKVLIGLELP